MAEQQLIDYIKSVRKVNQPDAQTRQALQKNGWTDQEINDAFDAVGVTGPAQAQPQQPKPQQQQPPQQKTAFQAQPQNKPVEQKPATQPSMAQMPDMRARKKPFPFIKILVILLIIILLGGGGFALALYGKVYDPLWNPFRPNPEKVINSMVFNMGNLKSYQTKLSGELFVFFGSEEQGKAVFSVNTTSGMTQENSVKTSGNVNVDFSVNDPGISGNADIDFISIDRAGYVRLNKISEALAVDTPLTLGKWLKIDKDTIKALNDFSGEITDIDIEKQIRFDAQDWKDLLIFNKQLPDQEVDGEDSYHYLLNLNKGKIKEKFSKDAALGASAQGMIDSIIDKFADIEIDVWIGKNDLLLHKYSFQKTLDMSELMIILPMKFDLKMSAHLSDFNRTVPTDEPAEFGRFEEEFLPALRAQEIKANMSALGSEAKLIKLDKKSYAELCYRGFLNGYSKEYSGQLISFYDSLTRLGSANPACFSSVNNYCVSTTLPDKTFICVGPNGMGTAKCSSSATVCK